MFSATTMILLFRPWLSFMSVAELESGGESRSGLHISWYSSFPIKPCITNYPYIHALDVTENPTNK